MLLCLQESSRKEKMMRNNIILECRQTSERIYITSKNKRNTPERLRLMKYSPKLQKRAEFVEISK